MGQRYDFLDFSVDTQNHQLSQAGNRLDITSTAYKLLTYFIDNPGVTISRQKITNHVWSNRIVSETSLDKLIQRLRKILGDTGQHKNIISTVHGEGFVFLPKVNIDEIHDKYIRDKKNNKKFRFSTYVLLPIILLVYYASTDKTNTDEIPIISKADASPMILALIPNITALSDKNQTWMIQGGMYYFKEKFNDSLNIELKNINLTKLADVSPQRYAIDLTNKNQIDSSIIVSVEEKDQQFVSEVIIRNNDGILAQQSFTSATIKSLFDSISNWSHEKLRITSVANVNTKTSTMSKNRFAVENYIRGMSAQLSGDAAKAINYFELATHEDQDFWLAWYELSLAYRHQGNYQKSLSIIKVLENSYLSDKNQLMIKNAEALNYYYMGNYNKGIEIINQSINIASKNNNSKDLAASLINKSLFARNLGNQKLALASINQSIQVILTLKGDNYSKLGSAYNALAGIEINLYDYESAQKHVLQAIENFNKSGDKRYKAIAQSRLSEIYYAKGEWKKGEKLTVEALAIQKELDNTLGQTTSYMRLIDYDILIGDFSIANDHLKILSELMDSISSKYQNDSYLITKIKILLLTKQLESALISLNKLKNTMVDDKRRLSYHILMLTYYKLKNNNAIWKSFAEKFLTENKSNPNFLNQPMFLLLQAQLANMNSNQGLAMSLYLQAQELAIQQHNTITLAKVVNAHMSYLLKENKIDQAYQKLLVADQYNFPIYPYLKIKAQVLFSQGKIFKSTALLEELKSNSGGHWNIDDQLLLESFRTQLNTASDQ